FMEAVDEIQVLEKAGLHTTWVPEAYGFDAPSLMGYLAAKTSSVRIASGILPIYTRTPTLLAMTAAGVDESERQSRRTYCGRSPGYPRSAERVDRGRLRAETLDLFLSPND
ncbi:unnamed protein product, partial [marine sediment metagenome]